MQVWTAPVSRCGVREVTDSCAEQVLLPPVEGLLGSVVLARIVAASRWSVTGEVVPGVQHTSTTGPAESGSQSDSPAYDNGAADTLDCIGAEQPDSCISACSDTCDRNGAKPCEAAIGRGTDVRLQLPGTPARASLVPGTARLEGSGDVSSAERTVGGCLPDAARVPANEQQADLARVSIVRSISSSSSTSVAAEVRLHDARTAAPSGAASAGATAAIASAVSSAASAAASVIRQTVRSITTVPVPGSSAGPALRTAGKKEDFVDIFLALGVVLGLVGVLVVGVLDLLASFEQ